MCKSWQNFLGPIYNKQNTVKHQTIIRMFCKKRIINICFSKQLNYNYKSLQKSHLYIHSFANALTKNIYFC